MKTLILLCLVALAVAVPLRLEDTPEEREMVGSYLNYLRNYERDYEYDEMFHRYTIYRENLQLIQSHNSGESSFQLGLTNHTDWTWEEFKGRYLLKAPQADCSATEGNFVSQVNQEQLPASMDWRKKGVLYAVKNQGNCGSCWTFSTTGCLEAHWAIKTGKAPVSLSEQQLVDCAGAFDNNGCDGGLPSHAYQYLQFVGGLDTDASYPYTAKDGVCKFRSVDVEAKVPGGSVNITQGNEEGIHEAVGTVGPVSIAFEVVKDFQHYTGGVYSSTECGNTPESVNHAVVAVGYDAAEDGTPYWIVRNSWGASWGLSGYFHIVRNQNMCGLAECASYPDVHDSSDIPYIKN